MLTRALLLAVCLSGVVHGENHYVTMDPAEKFNITWSVDGTTPDSFITFTIRCETTGWVGIGLSPNGGMANSDIIVGWVSSNGLQHLWDMHTTSEVAPRKDKSQDTHLISATETNGVTTISFRRKLNTCDGEEDREITQSTVRLIYAYGDTDPDGDSLDRYDYHGTKSRGSRSVYLLDPKPTKVSKPAEALVHDVVMDNYKVPANDTTYYCSFKEFPKMDRKHHIISIEPVITPGNEALVHHIVLYECFGVKNEHIRNSDKKEGVCLTPEMPEFEDSCKHMVYAWAVGGNKFYFPERAGYPIGANDGYVADYYLLEMHYDNPAERIDWVDSSGFRITYTPNLRAHDVGTFTTGAIYGIVVPPKPDGYETIAICDSSCTRQWIPEDGIDAFSYILHAHLLGQKIRVDWYRNGKHIGIFAEDKNYDFNYQETRLFNEYKKILPGDELKVTCTYTDKSRSKVTYGNLGTRDEMCSTVVYYYPQQRFSDCRSKPDIFFNAKNPAYDTLSVEPAMSTENEGEVDVKVLNSVSHWTKESVSTFEKHLHTSTYRTFCYKVAAEQYPITNITVDPKNYPEIKVKEVSSCSKDGGAQLNEQVDIVGSAAVTSPMSVVLTLCLLLAWMAQ